VSASLFMHSCAIAYCYTFISVACRRGHSMRSSFCLSHQAHFVSPCYTVLAFGLWCFCWPKLAATAIFIKLVRKFLLLIIDLTCSLYSLLFFLELWFIFISWSLFSSLIQPCSRSSLFGLLAFWAAHLFFPKIYNWLLCLS